MPQFRFKGFTSQGKMAQGEFEAVNKKAAKKKLQKLVELRNLQIKTLEEKQRFTYKIKKDGKGVIAGEQDAYNKEDVERALQKLGYKVVGVQKPLFNFSGGVPYTEIVTFIRLSADLLKQKLSYDEILTLLYEDTSNKKLKETIKQIQKDLKDGKEGFEVYGKHESVFGKFAAYMLSVASTSGNMALVFESAAKFLERDAAFKKNLKKALMMPTITVLAVIGVILFYVGYIFPKTAEEFIKMHITVPPMTAATLRFSHWLQNHWVIITACFVIPIVSFIMFVRTQKGRLWLDQNIIKIPAIGDLLHKTSIEIFARVFYTLYSGSGENIDVIKVACEACRNKYMEKQIKEITIKEMLQDGKGLVESLEDSGVFTQTALSRFRLGAESGALRNNAKQLAEYYEIQTTYKMETTVELINLGINLFIMVALIAITIVSSELAIVQPHIQGM